MRKTLSIFAVFFIASLQAFAQFYQNGEDPGRIRWYSIETPYYKIIYPQGVDSLARVYGTLLEQFRVAEGRSIGVIPGERQRRKMPVILHAYNPRSNGSVAWAPTRFDLFTLPQAYNSDPTPWEIQLAAHEPRHQAQLQWSGKGFMTAFRYIIGQGWNPVGWALYQGPQMGEGDAVVAETGLFSGGRARTADFIDYYRVALDEGDFRNWDRWLYGSFKRVTPNHYALGYFTLAGARYLYDDPLIMKKSLDLALKRPYYFAPYNQRKIIREHSGTKRFAPAFKDILQTFNGIWQENADERAPYMPVEQISKKSSYPLDHTSVQWMDGRIYLYRGGFVRAGEISSYKDGKFSYVKSIASHTSSLFANSEKSRFYWSETTSDPRWKLAGDSRIRYIDIKSGKTKTIAKGHRYYNPMPSADGKIISVVEYPVRGGSASVLLDADNGTVLRRIEAPDGVQLTESAWMGEEQYFLALVRDGYTLYKLNHDNSWSQVLPPSIQKVVNLGGGDENLEWVSDRSGANELYYYYPASGKLVQKTSSRHGGTDYCVAGDTLYFVSQTVDGKMLFRTPVSEMLSREVAWNDVWESPVEAKLTEQERALGPAPDLDQAVPISAPKRYYKWANVMRFHSWAPLYVNYDNIKSGSMDFTYETVSLGASAFFQNTLGNTYGMFGYSAHRDPDIKGKWRHSLHGKVVYRGQYPVFEASIDFNDQARRQYLVREVRTSEAMSIRQLTGQLTGTPSLSGGLKVYVPLSFTRGGLQYGFTPQVNFNISNNKLALSPQVFTQYPHIPGEDSYLAPAVKSGAEACYLSVLTTSLRGYLMKNRAENEVYPRFGIGLETGLSIRPGAVKFFTPNTYLYAYGYLPGIVRPQGLRLSAMLQEQLPGGDGPRFREMAVNTLPRGFDSQVASLVAQNFGFQWKITADYSIPIWLGDINIPMLAYISHFTLTPHADFTGLHGDNLWSAGADLTANLRRMIIFPVSSSIGVSFNWMGGSWYKNTGQSKPWSVEFIFGVDF